MEGGGWRVEGGGWRASPPVGVASRNARSAGSLFSGGTCDYALNSVPGNTQHSRGTLLIRNTQPPGITIGPQA